jgi:peptidoglycan/LPS O-acetylase OafA/YrhL
VFFPLSRLPEFLLGILLAFEVRNGTWFRLSPAIAITGALAAIAAAGIWVNVRYSICITLLPFVVLIGAVAMTDIDEHRTPLRRAFLVRLGQWSYAIYLLHYLVITAVSKVAPERTVVTTGLVWLLAAGASVGMAALLYHWWERPFERLLRPGRTDRSEEALGHAGYTQAP